MVAKVLLCGCLPSGCQCIARWLLWCIKLSLGIVGGCQGVAMQLLKGSEWLSRHLYVVTRVF